MTITVGQRVADMDPGLAMLRGIMGDGKPNHHGTVESIEGGTAYIIADDGGQLYPAPLGNLRPLGESS